MSVISTGRQAALACALLALAACDGERGSGGAPATGARQPISQAAMGSPTASAVSPGDAANDAPAKWKTVQQLSADWAGSKYEFTLSIPDGWNDAGDYTRLEIARGGKVVYALTDESGLVAYADSVDGDMKVSAKQNLLASRYLLMLPILEKSDTAALFVFGWAYGSSPGSLRVIMLGKDGIPRESLNLENFEVSAFADLNLDAHMELIGKRCFAEGFGHDLLTYAPYTVYKFSDAPGSPMTADLALSEAYNKKEYYGWAGPECREDVAVVMHPPGGGKPVVMDVKAAEKLFERKRN